jgi:hypothetical protein
MKFRCTQSIIIALFQVSVFLGSFNAYCQNGKLLKTTSIDKSGNSDLRSLNTSQSDYISHLYYAKIETPRELINGKEYESYYQRSEIKPLLFPGKIRTASIFTQTRRYDNLSIQYDTFLDEVIYTDTSRTVNFRFPQIALNKDILEGFNLYFENDSLKFRNYRLAECLQKNLMEGFYEVVYEGRSSYLIKHRSSYYQRQGLNNYKYAPENYISVGGPFYKIKNKKSLLGLFGEKSGQIDNYLHISRIKLKRADKNQIMSVLKLYDSLVR